MSFPPYRRSWTGRIPYLVLFASLALTAGALGFLSRIAEEKERAVFEYSALLAQERIEDRMQKYILAMRGVRGLFDSQGKLSYELFRNYAESLKLRERYPGIQGIGFTARVAPENLGRFVEAVRAETGNPSFRVWPENERPEYHSIVYLEPLDERNRAAIGYDMFSESVRRRAMEHARDSGRTAASGRVKLVQEIVGPAQPGFLVYVPVYASKTIPLDPAERKRLLIGYVYAPFRAGDFFSAIFGKDAKRPVDVEIYGGGAASPESFLYTTAQRDAHVRGAIEKTYRFEIAGRTWLMRAYSHPVHGKASSRDILPLAAAAGVAVSIALFVLSLSLSRAYARLEKAADSLRESEARKTAILESSLDAVISMDSRGNVIEWNAAAERTFGWTREHATGREMASLIIPPKYREAHRAGLAKYLRSGEGPVMNRRIEIEALRADGEIFPVELTITRIGIQDPPVFTGFLRDITERRRRERTLAFLAELNLATQRIESPDEIMAVTAKLLGEHLDVDRCAYAEVENESVFVITGDYPRGVSSIVGRWPVAAFGSECLRRMLASEAFVVDDSESDPRIGPADLPAYRATMIRSVICVPLHKGGKFTAAMAVHRKIPWRWTSDEIELVKTVVARCWESLERAKAVRDLRDSAEDLKRSNQRLEQFAYVSSHDLQEPLRKIVTFAERLDSCVTEQGRDHLERMRKAALRMRQVIEDLLQYSRLSRFEEVETEKVGLTDLIGEVVSDLEMKIAESGGSVRVESDAVLIGNRTQLHHLFQNLFTNSLKFARPGIPPEVVVSAEPAASGRTRIRVSDNGIGFDPQYAQKVFLPFQRLHGRGEYEGTGIGLAIVQTIVHNHGGSIRAEGVPGSGATFVLELPAGPAGH